MEADAAGRIRMFLKRRTFNPKRRLYPEEGLRPRQQILSLAIDGVRYSGNPEHKRNPGDFGLNPPSSPKGGKNAGGPTRRKRGLSRVPDGGSGSVSGKGLRTVRRAVSATMNIDVDWLPPFQGSKEIQRTSAAIRIVFGSENATRHEDEFSQSVQQAVRVSAYPLALWLATSWWRIRWEPLPSRIRLSSGELPADVNWRMSHEVAAAGHGFVWPRLVFASDGDTISVQCRPTSSLSEEPVRYLSEFDVWMRADEFETATDQFVDLVLRRLDSLGETELHVLWKEVLSERADPDQAAGRRIEARLGYDPDEAPLELVGRIVSSPRR